MFKCTIAIPVYNRENSIRRALDSALVQDVPDLEILVVDNCSIDHTWEILQAYRDPRLHLVRNTQNVGLFGNFNRCLSLARGQYLRFLCSDDTLTPGTLRKEIAVMDKYPNIALLSTRGRRIDEYGHVLGLQANHFNGGVYCGRKAIYAILWFQSHYAYNPLNYPSGVLIRRDVAAKIGDFDVSMKILGDVDFFLRILEHGDLAVLNDFGCNIMIHGKQESSCLLGDKAPIVELDFLIERYRNLLQNEGAYYRIKQQISAYVLGLAFKYWRMGLNDACRKHLEIVQKSGILKVEVLLAVLRLVSFRLLRKTIGIRFLPACPSKFKVSC